MRCSSSGVNDGIIYFVSHIRAEPVLSRIKQDPKRIILPSIDNIKHKSFTLERYENSGHGFNWELWCMYISPPKQWWDEGDTSAPIRCVILKNMFFTILTLNKHGNNLFNYYLVGCQKFCKAL